MRLDFGFALTMCFWHPEAGSVYNLSLNLAWIGFDEYSRDVVVDWWFQNKTVTNKKQMRFMMRQHMTTWASLLRHGICWSLWWVGIGAGKAGQVWWYEWQYVALMVRLQLTFDVFQGVGIVVMPMELICRWSLWENTMVFTRGMLVVCGGEV